MRDALWSSVLLPPSSGECPSLFICPRMSELVEMHKHTQELFVLLVCSPSRFGSFEIFKRADENTGRHGPSYGRDEIRVQMMDYVIEMFYPEIQQTHPDRVERNVAFFREVRAHMSDTLSHPATYTFQLVR